MKKITRIEPAAATKKKKKRRVAAYCRVSTATEDQLVSLDAQKAHYEEYITAHPDWEFAGLYYDEGISGTKKEIRPALMKLIADCEDGAVEYIVTKSLSRFARNTTDCLELIRKLLDLGVAVYFEKENLDTGSMESELLLSIMSSLAESESVSISENEKWSIRNQFENGTFKIGYAPFGYTVTDGVFSINEEEARWVRYIFAETLAGKSAHQIARDLNSEGVPVRRGSRWHGTTICGMLRNEKYIGDCLFQKTFTDFRFRRHTNRGDVDQFYVEDHHPAIISREDFEAAGRMLSQHAKQKNVDSGTDKYSRRYPFTKRIVCGVCGSTFKRRIINTGTSKYVAWVCKEHLSHKENCPMQSVREEALENAYTTMMNKLVFGRAEVLETLLDSIRGRTHKASLTRMNEIDALIDGMAGRRQNLTTIMTKGYLDPAAYTQEMNSLTAEAAALTEERENLTREINGDMRKTEELRELLKYTRKAGMLMGFAPELFIRFVDHVTVCSREEAVFHLRCGLSLRERIR